MIARARLWLVDALDCALRSLVGVHSACDRMVVPKVAEVRGWECDPHSEMEGSPWIVTTGRSESGGAAKPLRQLLPRSSWPGSSSALPEVMLSLRLEPEPKGSAPIRR